MHDLIALAEAVGTVPGWLGALVAMLAVLGALWKIATGITSIQHTQADHGTRLGTIETTQREHGVILRTHADRWVAQDARAEGAKEALAAVEGTGRQGAVSVVQMAVQRRRSDTNPGLAIAVVQPIGEDEERGR